MENNVYTKMQIDYYQDKADMWTINSRDHVVGGFEGHNQWPDYEVMFEGIPDLKSKAVLDFGTGPGRNLVKYDGRFARMDGVDFLRANLVNAKLWMAHNGLDPSEHALFECNGYDLRNIASETYDVVMSTITLQHICVYDIRFSYFKEFFRVLKPGGCMTLQMGYGSTERVPYRDNNWGAIGTNGVCDVSVRDPDELRADLEGIGFVDFSYEIKRVGPGDSSHPNWIYFKAIKPL